MSGSTRRASFLLLVPIVPRAALACGFCSDRELAVWTPFAGAVTALWLLWMISLLVMKSLMKRRGWKERDIAPVRSIFKTFALAGVIVILVGILGGGFHWPGALIATPWSVYLVIKLISGLRREAWRTDESGSPDTEPQRTPRMSRLASHQVSPGATKAFFILNATFLALAALSVPASYIYAGSTSRMIALLDYPCSGTKTVLIPGLIRKGEAAVGPLVDASTQALKARSGPRQTWILNGTLFCLGRIGGPDAEAFLSKVVAERVDFQDSMDSEWQKTACFAYAECAGGRAVPVLVGVYQRCETAKVDDARKTVLAALSKTGSEEGAAFVREHE